DSSNAETDCTSENTRTSVFDVSALRRIILTLTKKMSFVVRMAYVSSQPQFRYTQTPSKVLQLRNLPWECTEEELIELRKPFSKVMNRKCNVRANRNQAFIEFAEQNQAIAMISYYASSSELAQVSP
ncbi:hypothetical protein SSX86_031902, partial [Deinandra increscens subsp. villosa]